MSPPTRRKAPKPQQTNSPSFRLNKVEHESPSSSPDKLKKPEITTISQEFTETQEESKSGDSNGGSVSKYGFDTPQTKSTSQEFENHKSTKQTCSPSFEVKRSKTIPEKADKCGYSIRAGFSSLKVKKEGNKFPFDKTQDCSDLEVIDIGKFQLKNSHLKEYGGSGRVYPSSVEQGKSGFSFQKPEHFDDVSTEDSCVRELKRLQQRCHELDNEREALMLAIGNDMGLTANIQLLHEYNTIKDITQIVIGSLSNILNIPVTQLHEELNLSFEK